MIEHGFIVHKNYAAIRVPTYTPPTADEIARWERARLGHENHIRAGLENAPATLRPIIALHFNNDNYCGGCDGGPDDSGEWPCRTIELIADIYDPSYPLNAD